MYRFALYGRSDAGKTCLLATLTMGAEGHPRGLTVERIPVAETIDDQKGGREQELAALRAGRDWIDQAVAQLCEGTVPEGNPPLFDGAGMIVDFNIGSPKRGSFNVRTVDYSGELIKPDEEDTLDSAASLLRRFLSEYDGYLILAETPREDDSRPEHLSYELQRLREAFVSLRRNGAGVEAPVAVVLTKWDRRSTVSHAEPNREIEKLREFLLSHPSHASLVQSISNALADSVPPDNAPPGEEDESGESLFANSEWFVAASEPPFTEDDEALPDFSHYGGLQHGNCAVFPASAFGQAERHGTLERPARLHTPPFGLLEPFVWLADRRDAIDVQHLNREYRRFPNWLYWMHPRQLLSLRGRAGLLARRVPRSSRSWPTLDHLRRRLNWRWRRQCAEYILLPGALFCILWTVVCAYQFNSYAATIDNPQSSEARLLATRDWLDRYRLKPWPLYGLHTAREAKELINQIDERLEQFYWAQVEEAGNDQERYRAARTYLDRLKNGLHRIEARQIVTQFETERAQTENEQWLAARESEVDVVGQSEAELKQLLDRVSRGLPHREKSAPAQRTRWMRLRDAVTRQWTALVRQHEWEDFLVRFNSQVSSLQLQTAAELLVNWELRSEPWKELVREFPERTRQRVTPEVNRRLRDSNFESARDLVRETGEAWGLMERVLREKEPELAEHLLKYFNDLGPLRSRVDERHDRHLYQVVQRLKTRTSCQRYLDGAPMGIMRRSVQSYNEWLTECTRPMTLTVAVRIFWTRSYGKTSGSTENDHQLTVSVDDTTVLVEKGLEGRPEELSGEVGRFELQEKKLEHRLKIGADLDEIDPLANDDAGSGSFTIPLSDLQQEKTLVIAPADGSAFDNQIRLKIVDGVPPEPELPTWKNPSSSH